MGSKGPKNGKITVGGKAAARSSWDSRPGRQAELQAAIGDDKPISGSKRRKDTRRWCGGHEGREHDLIIVRDRYVLLWPSLLCGWRVYYRRGRPSPRPEDRHWTCHHIQKCQACGKILQRFLKPRDCPDYPGDENE
jgi:hypothetical protein